MTELPPTPPPPHPLEYHLPEPSEGQPSAVGSAAAGVLVGSIFGVALVTLAFVTTLTDSGGVGLAWVASSPVGLCGPWPLPLVAAPLIWAGIGGLAGVADRWPLARLMLGLALAAHYVGLPMYLVVPPDRAALRTMALVGGFDAMGGFLYLGGQALLWHGLLTRRHPP